MVALCDSDKKLLANVCEGSCDVHQTYKYYIFHLLLINRDLNLCNILCRNGKLQIRHVKNFGLNPV